MPDAPQRQGQSSSAQARKRAYVLPVPPAAPAAPLGNYAKFASPPPAEPSPAADRRAVRYQLQAAARQLLPGERVARCHWVPLGAVAVHYGLEHRRAFFSGLETCSSVWTCPVCSAKIAERRRLEVQQAVEAHTAAGGVVCLVTFTVRHHRGDDLDGLLDALLEAQRRLRSGAPFQRFKNWAGFVGAIRALETTHSDTNGWHPHLHDLFFLDAGADLGRVEQFLRDRWAAQLARFGISVNEHGLSVEQARTGDEALALYVSKLGTWDLAAEMTRAATKQARGRVGRTPAALLWDYSEGEERAGVLWVVYARAFKGRNHLRWSAGLRARLLPDVEQLTDEQIAAKWDEVAVLLAVLSLDQWRAVRRAGLRAQLLAVADSGDPDRVAVFLASFIPAKEVCNG